MYRVKFARKLSDNRVDIGDVVLCAASIESAIAMTVTTFALPVTDTQFEAARLKPSLYQVSRRTIDHSLSTFDAKTIDEAFASAATFPATGERDWYSVSVAAEIRAPDEKEAIRMISRAIWREAQGEAQKKSVKDLDIAVERSALRPRIANVEQNALYLDTRIFQGGDTRT